ncbi:uncharacterized protein FFC1_00648 [Fusarium fujikuroi]|nr:uncharacterized protein FFC1_00648 [Fusarium fujikuroi]
MATTHPFVRDIGSDGNLSKKI